MTVTAQGGCVAGHVEQPCEAERLSAVFEPVNETVKVALQYIIHE